MAPVRKVSDFVVALGEGHPKQGEKNALSPVYRRVHRWTAHTSCCPVTHRVLRQPYLPLADASAPPGSSALQLSRLPLGNTLHLSKSAQDTRCSPGLCITYLRQLHCLRAGHDTGRRSVACASRKCTCATPPAVVVPAAPRLALSHYVTAVAAEVAPCLFRTLA